jgi:hypothetical protein
MCVLYIVAIGTQEVSRKTGIGLLSEQHSQLHGVQLRVKALLTYQSDNKL